MEDTGDQRQYFGVRCVVVKDDAYEERITLWHAKDAAEAIALAEAESREYAADTGDRHLNFAQCYELTDNPTKQGAEVFSLIRFSELAPDDYLTRQFHTGTEAEGDVDRP